MNKLTSCLLMILTLGISCTQNMEEEKIYGDISGIVLDKNVGTPISIAQVQLTPGGISTVTGTDGSFSFNEIEVGSYTVSVTKKGYKDATNKVTVSAGKKADCHLLMERIPAYVTADKAELDFGDNLSLTTLSFNIVNSSYENLSWHIEYDKSSSSFIAEVSPNEGTTLYGKTAVIVVRIDREKLNAGENKSTIVVVSDNGDGSSEVKIRAIGQEREKASLNMIEVSEVTSSTAIITGEITAPGIPSYEERGFVVGLSNNPTLESSIIPPISVARTEEPRFSAYLKDLVYENKYYVRAYAINDLGIAYSANEISFTMVATLPDVSMYSIDNLNASNKQAMAHGSVDTSGDPYFTERGFVFSADKNTPTIDDRYIRVDGSELGTFEAWLTDLTIGNTYYVRSYAKNKGGIAYSKDAQPFTLAYTLPEVALISVSDADCVTKTAVFRGTIKTKGDPSYTERGFVYSSSNEMPTISDNVIIAEMGQTNNYEAVVTGLALERDYYVRAYAINEGGVGYSEEPFKFRLPSAHPSVKTLSSTNINRGDGSVTLNGSIEHAGNPEYTEKGFVYSKKNSSPTLTDSKIVVEGSGMGNYSISTSFDRTGTTYVRAYATNELGTEYGETIKALGPEYVYLQGSKLYVQISDRGVYNLANASSACNGITVEGKTGWRLPTIDELRVLYTNKNIIGGFGGVYWSKSYTSEKVWDGSYVKAYYVLDFSNGSTSTVRETYSQWTYSVRCVK